MPVEINEVVIQVEVEDRNDPVYFNHLTVTQRLADANQFSYRWRLPASEVSLEVMLNFYKDNLGKQVSFTMDAFHFKGIIQHIQCVNQDDSGAEFEISGRGLPAKEDQVKQCRSFYKKKLKQVLESTKTAQDVVMDIQPVQDDDLFYTVQYNQTNLEFLRMLVARHGEWMYYTGEKMVIGALPGDSVDLKYRESVHRVSIQAGTTKTSVNTIAFDHYRGEALSNTQNTVQGSGFLEASLQAGDRTYGSEEKPSFAPIVPTQNHLERFNQLNQKAKTANAVQVRGMTYNSNLKLGGKIKLKNERDEDIGEFIIIELVHISVNQTQYKNHFVAIPSDVEVPPYTNPELFPVCQPQYAVVTDNIDKDGLDRLQVKLAWQAENEHTPWLSMTTPHAGKDKGFRFIPEVGDEVLVGFLGDNAERPFVLGAVYTDANKSGEDHADNSTKIIGSRSGRRLEIRDKQGLMALQDFDSKKTLKGNTLYMANNDKELFLSLNSQSDDHNASMLRLTKESQGKFYIIKGGSPIVSITLDGDGKKISIQSTGSIEIHADGDLTMNASNIKMEASNKVSIEGKQGVEVKGMKVTAKADMELELSGTTSTVKGDAQLELKGGAMASLQAGIVKIN